MTNLRQLAERATRGEWESRTFADYPQEKHFTKKVHPIQRGSYGSLMPQDADYIAAANPTAILALLDRIDELEEALARSNQK